MFTVTPEYRFLDGTEENPNHESVYLDPSREFATWDEVKDATSAYLANHTYADQVFFKIEKADEVNYLWVGFFQSPDRDGWVKDQDWYNC